MDAKLDGSGLLMEWPRSPELFPSPGSGAGDVGPLCLQDLLALVSTAKHHSEKGLQFQLVSPRNYVSEPGHDSVEPTAIYGNLEDFGHT